MKSNHSNVLSFYILLHNFHNSSGILKDYKSQNLKQLRLSEISMNFPFLTNELATIKIDYAQNKKWWNHGI